MQVRHDQAVADRDGLHAANLLVLADGRNVVGQRVSHGAAARIGSSLQRFNVIRTEAQRRFGGLAHKVLELVVLGDEVGFRVDLYGHTLGAGNSHANQAFSGGAAGLLGNRGKALGAQQVNGGFHVAIGVVERLLAIHHAGAGALAQVLHVSGGVSH